MPCGMACSAVKKRSINSSPWSHCVKASAGLEAAGTATLSLITVVPVAAWLSVSFINRSCTCAYGKIRDDSLRAWNSFRNWLHSLSNGQIMLMVGPRHMSRRAGLSKTENSGFLNMPVGVCTDDALSEDSCAAA